MATDTKDIIIRQAAALVHAQGFNHTGLQQILDAAGIPKGSFYFYFKSKEDLGLALVDHFTKTIGIIYEKYLRDDRVTPLIRIENLLNHYERQLIKTGFRFGCPIGNLSLEMSDLNESFREKLNHSIGQLVGRIMACLTQAQMDGTLSGTIVPGDAARFIFHGFEGAIMHVRVARSIEPMRIFRRSIMEYLTNNS